MGVGKAIRPDLIRQVDAFSVLANITGSVGPAVCASGVQIRSLCGLGTTDAVQFGSVGIGIANPTAGRLQIKQTAGVYNSGLAVSAISNDSFLSIRYDANDTFLIEPTYEANGAYKALGVRTGGVTRLSISTDGTSTFSGAAIFSDMASCPGVASQSERFGKFAAAPSYGSTAYGAYANASGYGGTAIGSFATAVDYAVAVGHNTFTSQSAVTVGRNAGSATSFQYVAIGQSATPGANVNCISLGMDAANTASNQFQVGAATVPITQQRYHTNGGSLTFANETGTFLTVANAGAVLFGGRVQETYQSSAINPTVSDIASGKRQGWYNSALAEFRDWVNVAGTLLKSAAYT